MGIGYVKRNMNGKFNIQTIYSESIWKFRELCTVFFGSAVRNVIKMTKREK